MTKVRRVVSVLLATLFAVSLLTMTGCTKHPSDEQLQALEEQKQAALAAEKTLEDKRSEKNRLESELNRKKKELQDAKNELAAVKQRLGE
jgi:septal ring factor EnvC (AmiA/AmiB activator)